MDFEKLVDECGASEQVKGMMRDVMGFPKPDDAASKAAQAFKELAQMCRPKAKRNKK